MRWIQQFKSTFLFECFQKWRIQNLWPHACCISSNHTPNHAPESYPRIIPRIIPMVLKHVLKHAGYYYGIGKSWWSLFCGSKLGGYVYLLACRPCLSRYGRSQGCQTMSPEWPSTQDVIFFVLYLTKLCPSTLFLQKQAPARVIPRAWCRRGPFDIGYIYIYKLYVDSL